MQAKEAFELKFVPPESMASTNMPTIATLWRRPSLTTSVDQYK